MLLNPDRLRIDEHLARQRIHEQVHVFHRDGAEQRFIAEHHRADETTTVLPTDLNRTDVRATPISPVGERRVALLELVELESVSDVMRDTQVRRPGIHERVDPYGRQIRPLRIAQFDRRVRQAHVIVSSTHG